MLSASGTEQRLGRRRRTRTDVRAGAREYHAGAGALLRTREQWRQACFFPLPPPPQPSQERAIAAATPSPPRLGAAAERPLGEFQDVLRDGRVSLRGGGG